MEMNKITEIDNEVHRKLSELHTNLQSYKDLLEELKSVVGDTSVPPGIVTDIKNSILKIQSEIDEIQNLFQFYTLETYEMHGKCKNVSKYIRVAKKYCEVELRKQVPRTMRIVCSICKSDKFDIENDTTHICRNCGNQKDIFNISPSHKDTSRINTALRYTYKRKIHFKDCINQYQGKQNSNINSKVFDDLRENIRLHELCNGDDYSRVTKEHLMMFLKDRGYTKHYEDINLIYKIITGNPTDDIGYLEEALLHDFNILTDMYDKKFKQTNRISRKSFINTQYVLFQLLKRHGHPCRSADFNILKTVDRKSLHEEIISELFNDLGWNFTSLF